MTLTTGPDKLATCKTALSRSALMLLGLSLGLLLASLAAVMISYNLLRNHLDRSALQHEPGLAHHRHGIKNGARLVHRLLPFQPGH